MNSGRGTRAVREMMLPGVETIQGVQEGFMSAAEKSRELNIQLIDMAVEYRGCIRFCPRNRGSQGTFRFGRGVDNQRD